MATDHGESLSYASAMYVRTYVHYVRICAWTITTWAPSSNVLNIGNLHGYVCLVHICAVIACT